MIVKKIQADQITALKSGQKTRLEVLRYILAQIKNKEIEKKAVLTDEETTKTLQKVAKELKESIDAAKKGNRNELVEGYQKQLVIVEEYLPKVMLYS